MRRNIALLLLLLAVPAAAAEFPGYINYQGKLGNPAGNPLTGTYSFAFRFYTQKTGGTLLATDASYTGANAVTVTNGLYSVQIGSLTAGGLPESVFHGPETWLEIDVSPGADLLGAETLDPRERLAAVPFAFRSATAEKLGTGVFIATFTSAGDLVAPSSITANAFFGDGSHLTGIAATDATKVAKAGDTMTGSLAMIADSTITVGGSAFSVGASTFVVDGGRIGIGVDAPLRQVHIVSPGANRAALGIFYPPMLVNNFLDYQLGIGTASYATWRFQRFNDWNKMMLFHSYAENILSIGNRGTAGIGQEWNIEPAARWHVVNSSYTTYALDISSNDTTTKLLVVRANGSVGVGTANPEADLDVYGIAQFGTTRKSTMTATGEIVSPSSITASAFYGYGGNLTGVTATDASKVAKAGDTMTGLLTAPDYAATYGVSAATAMFTANAGVGISVLPQARIHVSSPTQIGALGQSPAILIDGDQQGRGNLHFVTHEAVGQQLAFSYPEVTSHKSFGFDSNYNAWTFMDFAAGMGTSATPQVLLGGPTVGSRFGLPTGTYLTYPAPQAQVHISSGVAGRSLLIDGDAAAQAIFNGTGNVGIGTPSPASKLHLSSGTITVDGDAANSLTTTGKVIIGTSTSYGVGNLQVRNTRADRFHNIGFQNSDWDNAAVGTELRFNYGAASGDTSANIQTWTAGGTSQGPILLNPDGGGVGVGGGPTMNPSTTLDVRGSAQFGSGADKSTFTATGEIVSPSSVTASAFYGYGGNLTGITATDATKVAKAGDTMTGLLTAPDYVATYGVDAATFTAAIYSSAPVMIVSTISAPGSLNVYTDGGSRALVISQGGNGGARINIGTFSGSQIGNLEVFDLGSPTAYFRRNDTAVTAGEVLGEMDFRDQDTSTGGSSLKAYYRVQAEGGWGSGGTMEQSHRWGMSRGGNAATDYAVLNSSGLLVNGTGYFTGAVAVGVTDAAGGTLVVQSTSTTAGNPVVSARDNAGAELFRVQQDGKAGFGTSTPGYALSVYRSGAGVTANVESGSDGSAAQARFAGRTDASAARVWGAGLNITDGGGGFEIYDYTAGASRLYAGVSGSVGIGTVGPCSTCTLHVAGGASVTGNLAVGGTLALKQVTETSSALGAGTDIDWSLGTIHTFTLTANRTLTYSGAAAGQTITLIITQGGTGSYTITWPTTKWPAATAPTLTTAVGKADIVSVFYDGTSYWGFVGGQNY